MRSASWAVAVQTVREPSRSSCRVRLDPPLMIGLERNVVPRASAAAVVLARHVSVTTLDPALASAVIRAAHLATASAPATWALAVSDFEVVSSVDGDADDDEVARAAMATERAARAIETLIRGRSSPWKRALVDAWTLAAHELGGVVDQEALTLSVTRQGLTLLVSVMISTAGVTTTIAALGVAPLAAVGGGKWAEELDALGLRHVVVDSGAALERTGLVASAEVLRDLLDVTFRLVGDLTVRAGPYR